MLIVFSIYKIVVQCLITHLCLTNFLAHKGPFTLRQRTRIWYINKIYQRTNVNGEPNTNKCLFLPFVLWCFEQVAKADKGKWMLKINICLCSLPLCKRTLRNVYKSPFTLPLNWEQHKESYHINLIQIIINLKISILTFYEIQINKFCFQIINWKF